MNKFIVVSAILIISAVAVSLSVIDQLAVAVPQTKIQFTKTITSSHDPGIGQEGFQFALLLSANQNSLYHGSVTYTSSEPVEIIVLHDLDKQDSNGQATWSVDGNTIYGISVIGPPTKADSFDFTGAALGFRSKVPFTVTASVDGWIRGEPTQIVMQKIEPKSQSFTLSKPHVPVSIPMHLGFFAGGPVSYIITDSSNKTFGDKVTGKQNWSVEFSPRLAKAPASAQDTVYSFTNGIKGEGLYGYQNEIFSSSPSQSDLYSPLHSLITVSWKQGQKAQILNSAEAVLKAEKESRVKLVKTNVVINAPHVLWPGGQLQIRNSTDITDESSFDKGQVLSISNETRKVTFVAHRGWGLDGRTIYYIITDATPAGPANLLGVSNAPKLANVLSNSIVSEMYQFKNGVRGPGPLGYQASILSSTLEEGNYIPICRVSIVEWNDPTYAGILETISDINNKKSEKMITVQLARPLSNDHIVNCPLIESLS
ncbi:MAG: hypothetical protein EPO62_07765 [Candidatus Nitrosotenuis sp.]|nr:MAG: hypothetical protein EPO62_07765 [Candidatus Nitrosotenuis sp.]